MGDYRAEEDVRDDSPPLDYERWSKAELIAEVEALNTQVAKWVRVATERRGAVAAARAEQREETIRYAAEWLRTLGRGDMAVALVRALSVAGGR